MNSLVRSEDDGTKYVLLHREYNKQWPTLVNNVKPLLESTVQQWIDNIHYSHGPLFVFYTVLSSQGCTVKPLLTGLTIFTIRGPLFVYSIIRKLLHITNT